MQLLVVLCSLTAVLALVCRQGYTLGRCASADTEGNSNAAQLELSVSEGESPRISGSPGQAEKLCYKTSIWE